MGAELKRVAQYLHASMTPDLRQDINADTGVFAVMNGPLNSVYSMLADNTDYIARGSAPSWRSQSFCDAPRLT